MDKIKLVLPSVLLSTSLLLGACGANEETTSNNQPEVTQENSPSTSLSPELEEAVAQYRQYGLDQTDQFVKDTETFVKAVKSGDLENAKVLYAQARMPYERIEPIAESLGDLDPKIDARENDVPLEEWSGFHLIEKSLWVDGTTDGMEQYADQLLNDVKSLRAKIEIVEVQPQMLVTGAVDLLNEVSASKITGEEERYSHTDLYDFAANVQGAEKIYQLLKPIILEKNEQLSNSIESQFTNVWSSLEPYKTENGYVLYTDLSKDDTQKLSQAIDALAEPLSQIGIILGE